MTLEHNGDKESVCKIVVSQMGYAKLRPKLEEIILHFVSGNDVLVSLHTQSRTLRHVT